MGGAAGGTTWLLYYRSRELISAALKPSSRQALVLELVAFRAVEMFISEAVMAEYREVFSRLKFSRLDPKDVALRLPKLSAAACGIQS